MKALSDEALAARVRGLFPALVSVGLARSAEGGLAHLIGAEGDATGRMVPARRAEYAAGRLALRRAQEAAGLAPFAVPNGADRAPVWPDGCCGSISHAGGLAMAVLGRRPDGLCALGLDIEEDTDLPVDLQGSVLRPAERAALAGCKQSGRSATTIFCIKECVYKAQYPLTGRLFGFEMIEVRLTAAAGAFSARFTADAAPFRAGDCLRGRYSTGDGLVIAALALSG